jgi:hypothetical protein
MLKISQRVLEISIQNYQVYGFGHVSAFMMPIHFGTDLLDVMLPDGN